jgi:hypothetical protein
MKPHRFGVVSIAALDLRRFPDHRSEMRSQLLLGERVRILTRTPRGRWARVENASDRYRGWVRTWGLLEMAEAEAQAWERRARFRIAVTTTEVRARPGAGAVVTPVFWNARVAVAHRSGAHRQIELPDGRRGWVGVGALRPAGRPAGALASLLSRFEGVPYLWGGRTPLGFDCSGFVQQVLCARNVPLPRDADEQFRFCEPVTFRRALPGDLVFFGRPGMRVGHVGILRGGGLFVHARGTVHLGSLDPHNPLYDQALAATVRGFGRPPRGERAEGHSC